MLLLLNGGIIIKVLGNTALLQIVTVAIMFLLLFVNGRLFVKKTGVTILFLVSSLLLINSFHFFSFDYGDFFSNQIINFIVLICIGVFVGNQFLNRTSFFILRLNKTLKILIIHAILSCIIISLFPTNNTLFISEDEKSAYVGYFNLIFKRTTLFILDFWMKLCKTF